MTTRQIDFCIELAHTLNFSRASENVYISQPTLSYQIKMLEDEVGFTIFERSSKSVSVTPAGRQFISFLSDMRQNLKRAIEQGQNFSRKYTDSITVSLMVRQALFSFPKPCVSSPGQIRKSRSYLSSGMRTEWKNSSNTKATLYLH